MGNIPTYRAIIAKNFENEEWRSYARGEGSLPNWPETSHVYAGFFYYLGDIERAQAASKQYSEWQLSLLEYSDSEISDALTLFRAALYVSLAGDKPRAQELWGRVALLKESVHAEDFNLASKAHGLVQRAYALAKLDRYSEVSEPAKQGFQGILDGKANYKDPKMNAGEYRLADVLMKLSSYQQDPDPEHKQRTQKSLQQYKDHNVKYGRLGYPVIFDLQISYPDVFSPVLPGPDPEAD